VGLVAVPGDDLTASVAQRDVRGAERLGHRGEHAWDRTGVTGAGHDPAHAAHGRQRIGRRSVDEPADEPPQPRVRGHQPHGDHRGGHERGQRPGGEQRRQPGGDAGEDHGHQQSEQPVEQRLPQHDLDAEQAVPQHPTATATGTEVSASANSHSHGARKASTVVPVAAVSNQASCARSGDPARHRRHAALAMHATAVTASTLSPVTTSGTCAAAGSTSGGCAPTTKSSTPRG
jgi:hypothetical protein